MTRTLKNFAMMTGVVVIGVTAVVGFVGAATTISTAITTAGNITTTAGTLNVNGLSTLSGGATTTTLVVGSGSASTISGLAFGYCNLVSISVTSTSTTGYTTCTGATGVTAVTDRVFVQATSSLPSGLFVEAASSTATAGTISIRLGNYAATNTASTLTSGAVSLNFWAVR